MSSARNRELTALVPVALLLWIVIGILIPCALPGNARGEEIKMKMKIKNQSADL